MAVARLGQSDAAPRGAPDRQAAGSPLRTPPAAENLSLR
jgi:hypothetical protein